MSDIQEEQKRLYKRAEENDKTNKTLLGMKLLLNYYKNNNILDHYYTILGDGDGRLIIDNEILNNLENVNEKIYITTFRNHIELKDRINKALEYIECEMPCLWEVDEIFEDMDGKDYNTWKEYDENILLNILQGSDKE